MVHYCYMHKKSLYIHCVLLIYRMMKKEYLKVYEHKIMPTTRAACMPSYARALNDNLKSNFCSGHAGGCEEDIERVHSTGL